MVTKIPSRVDYHCDVVICEDNKLPESVKHAASLGIPIVSLEWLLQSLINGRQVPFDGHAKYDYRYKSAWPWKELAVRDWVLETGKCYSI